MVSSAHPIASRTSVGRKGLARNPVRSFWRVPSAARRDRPRYRAGTRSVNEPHARAVAPDFSDTAGEGPSGITISQSATPICDPYARAISTAASDLAACRTSYPHSRSAGSTSSRSPHRPQSAALSRPSSHPLTISATRHPIYHGAGPYRSIAGRNDPFSVNVIQRTFHVLHFPLPYVV